MRSVSVALPKLFATRGTTVADSCPQTTFASDPSGCANAGIGSVHAETPLLSGPLDGPVYLVAHPTGLPTIEALMNGPGSRRRSGAVPDVPITAPAIARRASSR